jgi:hypothetical protein
MLDRILSLVVAVSLSLLIWVYSRSRDQETLDNVPIPVKIVLTHKQSELYNLELLSEAQIIATFSGPPVRIRELHGMLQRKEVEVVKTITVPDDKLDLARLSDVVVVEPGDINAPLGVNALTSEGRNRVSYTLHRLDEKRFPVRFDHLREGPTGPVLIEPPTVLVRGPREVLERMQMLPTIPSELPTRPLHSPPGVAAVGRVALVDAVEGRPVKVTPPTVQIRVPGIPKKTYELTDVPVSFLLPPKFAYRPHFVDDRDGKVTLKIIGPPRDEAPKVTAYVDLRDGKFLSGLNNEPLVVQLPKDFEVAPGAPQRVTFELQRGDFNPDGLNPAVPPVP